MSEHDFKLFISYTKQPQEVMLYAHAQNPQARKPISLFMQSNIMQMIHENQGALSDEEWDILFL